MTNKELLEKFIENNDSSVVTDYRNKLYENIQSLTLKQEKHTLWLLLILLFYFVMHGATISNFSFGPVSFSSSSLLREVLPIVFIAIIFNLHSLANHTSELQQAFKIISANTTKEFVIMDGKNDKNYLYRMYLPFSTASFIYYLLQDKPKKAHLISALLLISPILILVFIPYFVVCYMLYDLWINHFQDLLGKISFFITLWIFIILLFSITCGRNAVSVEE